MTHTSVAPAPQLSADALACRERYALDASYACRECFGPLEVAYDLPRLSRDDIEGGPAFMWRYEALLPVEPGIPSRPGLHSGWTALVKADRLAAAQSGGLPGRLRVPAHQGHQGLS